ncbi:MAG: dehydratase [Dehalococcoidia bacterium]|nr:dehydratase [Dehalococcoidia bacterium]
MTAKVSYNASDKNFDRYEKGEIIMSPPRTITETDVVNFCALTGDWHPLHSDALFAAKTQFGARIAHGPLTFAICAGFMARSGVGSVHSMAFLGINNWTFQTPVYLGDTIQGRITVQEKRPSASKPDRGIVTFFVEVLNLTRESAIVCSGEWTNMYRRGT